MKTMVSLNGNDKNKLPIQAVQAWVQPDDQPVVVASIVERLPAYSAFPSLERHQHLQELLVKEASDNLDEVKKEFEDGGYKVIPHLLTGRYPENLIGCIADESPDLIVKGEYRIDERRLSKGDLKFLRECQTPICIVSEEFDDGKPIFIGLAVSPYDEDHNPFCLRLLRKAVDLAKHFQAELHIGHVWTLMASSLIKSRVTNEEFENLVAENQALHKQALEGVIEQVDFGSVKYTTHIDEGTHTYKLKEMIDKVDPQLIVMGSVGRSGVKSYLLGNTAEGIVADVPRNVLIVH